jgi:diguanylate cyclase (GGDEF)-like protein
MNIEPAVPDSASLLRRIGGDVGREYAKAVRVRRKQVWLRLAITLAVGSALSAWTNDVWVPYWIAAVVVTQVFEIAAFGPILPADDPARVHLLLSFVSSTSTTLAFAFAAPLMWLQGGTEAGAGSVMFLFGGSMMALMAAEASLLAFMATVLPYLAVGGAMSLTPIVTNQGTMLTLPLLTGFAVLTVAACLLWRSSSRTKRLELQTRMDLHKGLERAEAAENQARQLAYSDALTGLPNRHAFNEALGEALATETAFAILLLDLNGFKRVNDRSGHPAGDEVLKQVGSRLSYCVQPPSTPARLGGDEFAVVVLGMSDQEAVGLAWRLAASVEEPFITKDGIQRIGTSTGIALVPHHGRDPSQLMKRADLALYRSKATGRSEVVQFRPEMELRGDGLGKSRPVAPLRA